MITKEDIVRKRRRIKQLKDELAAEQEALHKLEEAFLFEQRRQDVLAGVNQGRFDRRHEKVGVNNEPVDG